MPRTRVLAVDPDAPDPATLREAARVLRDGGLVAFATETVYGLGADATRIDAVQQIFVAKGRPADNPLIVHVADVAMARRYAARWPVAAERLAGAWPGPLTLVVPRAPSIPDLVSAGLPTVGLRVPASAVARQLIAAADRPLAAPSANRSEHVSPTRAEHVLADLDGRIDMLLDSGPTTVGIESTVVDLCGEAPRVLRPGPLAAVALSQRLGGSVLEHGGEASAASPGQRPRHYAPGVPTVRVASIVEAVRAGLGHHDALIVVGPGALPDVAATKVVALAEPKLAARELYAALRDCDAPPARRIVVVMPPEGPQWDAIRDRLQRATTPAVDAE